MPKVFHSKSTQNQLDAIKGYIRFRTNIEHFGFDMDAARQTLLNAGHSLPNIDRAITEMVRDNEITIK